MSDYNHAPADLHAADISAAIKSGSLTTGSAEFGQFIEKCKPFIMRGLAYRGVGMHDAEDICQNIATNMIRSFSYDPQKSPGFSNWLAGVVRNEYARYVTHKKKLRQARGGGRDIDFLDCLAGKSTDPQDFEDRTRLLQILDAYPNPTHAELFKLRYLEGRPHADLAAENGMKEKALYDLFGRIRNWVATKSETWDVQKTLNKPKALPATESHTARYLDTKGAIIQKE